MRSTVVGVSSTTSCSMPATRHTTSSFMSASTLATARGCDTKGSPEILVWALCSEALNSYAFRSRLRSSPGREIWTFRTISSNCNIPTRLVMGQFDSRSGEFTSQRGGIKQPLYQSDPLPPDFIVGYALSVVQAARIESHILRSGSSGGWRRQAWPLGRKVRVSRKKQKAKLACLFYKFCGSFWCRLGKVRPFFWHCPNL